MDKKHQLNFFSEGVIVLLICKEWDHGSRVDETYQSTLFTPLFLLHNLVCIQPSIYSTHRALYDSGSPQSNLGRN